MSVNKINYNNIKTQKGNNIKFIPQKITQTKKLLEALKEFQDIEDGKINPKRYKKFEDVLKSL